MTTLAARAFTGLVLAWVLLAGCSDDGSSERAGPGAGPGHDAATTSDSASLTAPDGAVGSKECSLDREQLSLVVRDWGRVFGSIGREDHSTYTGAFGTLLAKLQPAARECNGATELKRFLAEIRRIDAGSRKPTPNYALYDAAVKFGNTWLEKVGYGNNALSVG